MARWDGNTLVVQWFDGTQEDEAAFWDARNNLLICDGNSETLEKRFIAKPDPETAFQAIKDWQQQG